MQTLSDDEKREVLGEVLADELKAIHGYVKDIPEMLQQMSSMDNRLENVESDIKVIKAAVTDHETQLHGLKSKTA